MEDTGTRRGSVDLSDLVMRPRDESFMRTVKVLAWFLFYSMAMFTLPFIAFVGTKYGILRYLGVRGFANTVWSVVAAVVVVNAIIMAYACKGFYEPDEDNQPEEEEEKKDK